MTNDPESVKCDFCDKPMSLISTRYDEEGRVIQRTFVCHCNGVLRYKNFHYTREEAKK